MDIFLPVMESSVILAAHYAKAAGRESITGQDMAMGLMYAARNVTGKQIGSMYPEVYDEEDEEEEEEDEEDDAEEFTMYTGTEDEYAMKMNQCAQEWDAWEPETPAEAALKMAVNKAKEDYV